MPSKTSKKKPVVTLPSIPKELIDQMVSGPMDAEAVNAASMAFKKALIERILGAELSHHLGYPPGAEKPGDIGNHRNGATSKTVLTDDGPLRIDVLRDRQGSFEPLLIPKHERRFTGFDDKIVAMYARGMTVREIQGFLAEQYGTEVSPFVPGDQAAIRFHQGSLSRTQEEHRANRDLVCALQSVDGTSSFDAYDRRGTPVMRKMRGKPEIITVNGQNSLLFKSFYHRPSRNCGLFR